MRETWAAGPWGIGGQSFQIRARLGLGRAFVDTMIALKISINILIFVSTNLEDIVV
jgi:hypothetical protein